MSSRTRKAAIDYAEWERVRPIIHQLYLVDGKTQRDTLKILSDYHGFSPSKAQLERKLKQWRMVRNITGPEWKYVDRVIRQRQSDGKGSQLYLSGIPLRPAAIEKARTRHCYETALEKCKPTPGPSFLEDLPLIVRTPSPMEQGHGDCCQVVPWLESMDFLKGLTLMIPRSERSADTVFKSLGVGVLEFGPNYARGALSHTAQLQQTYQALHLIMPKRSREDHITRAEAILNQSDFGNQEALETVFFLLSNNFLDRWSLRSTRNSIRIFDCLFELLHKSNGWALITSRPYLELPLSLRAILDRLFAEAVDRFDMKAVRLLLRAGVDINLHFVPNGMSREYGMTWSMRPFEYSAMLCNTAAVAFFVDNGADVEFSLHSSHNLSDVINLSLRNNRETLSLAQLILSYFVPRPECEWAVRRILHKVEKFGKSPVAELLIKAFRGKVVGAESISQLIITAIRTRSTLVPGLLSQFPGYVDDLNHCGETPLMAAAAHGDLQTCEQLLQLGASLEVNPKRSMPFNIPTPLQWAAYYADAETVRFFLDAGSQVNFHHSVDSLHRRKSGVLSYSHFLESEGCPISLSSMGKTALQAALLGRNEATAQLLLAEGALFFGEELATSIRTGLSKHIKSSWNRQGPFTKNIALSGLLTSTLEAAIIRGDHGVALHELNTNPSSITPEALYAAVWFTNLKSTSGLAFVRKILEQGDELRCSTDHWVGTAMSLAAELDSIQVVRFMLSYGLRPKSCLNAGRIYLLASVWKQRSVSGNGQTEELYLEWLSKLLLHNDNGKTVWPVLDDAAFKGRHDYLDLLLSYGYEPTVSCAVRAVHSDTSTSASTLQFLYRRGVKMTHYVLSGTILNADAASNEWLLSLRLDLNADIENVSLTCYEEAFTRTAIQAAAQMGDVALIDKLISQGADINSPAYHSSGVTALQAASIGGYFDIVGKLLEQGANPDAAGAKRFGRTALEGAAERGRLDVVQLLLSSGVATEGPSRRQYVRAIGFAKRRSHAAVATLLKSHRPWTEHDQEISNEDCLLSEYQTSQQKSDHQSASLDQKFDDGRELQLCGGCFDPPLQLLEEPIPSLTYEPLESFGQADLGRKTGFVAEHDDQSHSDEGYIELEAESLRFNHGEEAELVDISGTQEILGETENDFRPSGIFDQVKEDLELTGEGDRIWAEAYSAFSMELLC